MIAKNECQAFIFDRKQQFLQFSIDRFVLNLKGHKAISANGLEEFNGAINQPIPMNLVVIKSLLRDSE